MARIGRGRFIALTLLLAILFFAVGMALGAGAGIYERLGGSREDVAAPAMGMGALLVFGAVCLAVLVGVLNLVAKRARDIGWNPLLVVILFVPLFCVAWFVLALVPGRQG